MKKVLVTGGAGFIGSHLVDALLERGIKVDIIDDLSTGRTIHKSDSVQFFETDIAKVLPEGFINGYDTIFHLAAKARIQPSIEAPVPHDLVNAHGTVRALEIARLNNAKFIFSSSSSIYGPKEVMPEDEAMPVDPQNPYALQKYIGELYCDMYEKLYGLKVVKFRYFNVFGERQLTEGAYATVIGIFMKQKDEGKPFTIVGDGSQRRDFTYVKDVVAANILAAESDMAGLFNVGTGSNTSVLEIADAIGGPDYPREIGIVRVGEVQETLADNSKLCARGWNHTTSVLNWLSK